jgi:hypothetical protein
MFMMPELPRSTDQSKVGQAQFQMSRQQSFILTKDEANEINKALALIEKLSGKSVSVNRFVKVAVLDKTEQTLI